jgi:[protein-PII] uridylyltransferase
VLDAAAVDAPPGRPWAAAWTARVDAALRHHLDRVLRGPSRRRRGGVALVALGSYARRSLCPRSDVDLLLLHDGWAAEDLEVLVREVCYPLWDAGLSVGHAVRTPEEAVRAAGEVLDTATALTDRRVVAGVGGLADDLAARVARWLRRGGGPLASAIAQADAARRRCPRGGRGALEPDLKSGVGGLRDLHSLRWAGAILLGDASLDPLVGARYLAAQDRARLAAAGERLLAARCALHLVGGRAARDVLRLDLQDEVAARLGMADGDDLLRDVGLATRTIAHLHARTWPVLLADATGGRRRRRPEPLRLGPGLAQVDGLVEADPPAHVADDPALPLRAVAAAAERGTVLGRRTAVRLREELAGEAQLPWDDAARAALLTALRAGRAGLPAMQDADDLGVLAAMLPGWARVRGRPQRNPLHTFDVDTHLLQSAAWLTHIADGGLDPRHRDLWEGLADPDAVLLGTFLHDVGKAWPGDHAVAGEAVARDWAAHMGLAEARGEHVARLVRRHLLLPDVATQRDLEDDREVERVAVLVGDVEVLDGLLLLSLADARATGPAAWSEWKDLLLHRLHQRVRDLLLSAAPDDPVDLRPRGAGGPGRAVLARAAVRRGADPDAVRALLAALPADYGRSAEPDQVAAHAALLAAGRRGLAADVRPGPVPSTAVLSVVAPDRPGLFADLVGVLAAHRVDVLEARVATTGDGLAVDRFVVTPPDGADRDAVRRDLAAAAEGALDVAAAVARRERARDVGPRALAAPVPVTVRTTRAVGRARVEVRGPDSPGALHRISRALADLGVDLEGAIVATLGPEVHDTFLVAGDVPPDGVLEAALGPILSRS